MSESQESISRYATQSDISFGPKNQQRSRVSEEKLMCITGQQGAFRPGKEKGNEQIYKS